MYESPMWAKVEVSCFPPVNMGSSHRLQAHVICIPAMSRKLSHLYFLWCLLAELSVYLLVCLTACLSCISVWSGVSQALRCYVTVNNTVSSLESIMQIATFLPSSASLYLHEAHTHPKDLLRVVLSSWKFKWFIDWAQSVPQPHRVGNLQQQFSSYEREQTQPNMQGDYKVPLHLMQNSFPPTTYVAVVAVVKHVFVILLESHLII
jgi:hypothetical protein